jgi:phosphoadenosine phosphosulfate reductase
MAIPASTIPAITDSSAALGDSTPTAFDRSGRLPDPDQSRSWLESRDSQARLRWGWETFGEHFALTTSFGIQSAVLLHQVSQLAQSLGGVKIPVIWVDTGYLPPETYRYAEKMQQRLHFDLRVVQSQLSPARMEALHGRLWESTKPEERQLYNQIRKVQPLDQAFQELDVHCWASGVRGGQTDHRRGMSPLDSVRGLWSLRPLLSWTKKDIFYYMQEHDLPQHPLFDQGYSTVGDWHSSAPEDGTLTGRATRFGGLQQECGIHLPGILGEGI